MIIVFSDTLFFFQRRILKNYLNDSHILSSFIQSWTLTKTILCIGCVLPSRFNKKEIQLNLCNIFSILIFSKFYLSDQWLFNRAKFGHAVTFMKYLVNAVSLIFLPKFLIWNKITFLHSNLLNLKKFTEFQKIYQYY